MSDVLRVLAVLALVAGNAFFVIGEYAVVTARRATLAGRAERGSGGARAALRLMDNPVRVISTVQVGITAIGILRRDRRTARAEAARRRDSRLARIPDRVRRDHLPERRARRVSGAIGSSQSAG